MALSDVKIIQFPRIQDPRGNLTFVQDSDQVPFDIHRVYWLYDLPCDTERGGHSHRTLYQCLVAMAGSFDVTVTDGREERRFTLNRPYQGLLLVPGLWRVMDNFSSGSICMVLASALYDEADYIRDYDEFLKEVGANG